MRRAALALAIAACGGAPDHLAPDATLTSAAIDERAPVEPFTPPSPRGCAGAVAFDFCFAFDTGTPLAVRVTLPRAPEPGAIVTVRFARVVAGVPARNLDQVEFRVTRPRAELLLYFQVDPGAVRIDLEIDGRSGRSGVVDVGDDPLATSFALTE